ncbi:MAG: S8 family serine peptidase [Bacteroidota bacterium]|nr:S8 family serine peptidase [Bacteroidota bacterium]
MRIFGLLFLLVNIAFAQNKKVSTYLIKQDSNKGHENYYLIYFKDKPAVFNENKIPALSARSILRRARQGILLSETDYPVSDHYIRIISQRHIKIMGSSRWLNAIVVESNQKQLFSLGNLPFVKKIEPLPYRISKPVSLLQTQSAFGLSSSTQLNMLELDKLHAQGFTGKGKLIAIFDNGFTNANTLFPFQRIFKENRFIASKNFVDSRTVFETGSDGEHGCMTFSLIGSYMPPNFFGSAYDASFALAVTEDMSREGILEEINWFFAAEWADSLGADIISSSLGYATKFTYGASHTYDEMDGKTTIVSIAANYAASKGILVVSAAGNEGDGAWQYITAPADADSCLAVGAVDEREQYVYFSSKGPSYDGRIKPDVAAMGGNTTILYTDGDLREGSGTSFACPLVAGFAACMWQVSDSLKNMQLFELIKESGNQAFAPDTLLGWGVPSASYIYEKITGKELPAAFATEHILQILPNPIQQNFTVSFYHYGAPMEMQLVFYHLNGSESKKIILNMNYGFNFFSFSARDLQLVNGFYGLLLTDKNQGLIAKNKILILE